MEISYHLGIPWAQESAPEIRRRWDEIVSQTAAEWLAAFPDTNEAISYLENISAEFETHGYQTSFHGLFTAIGQIQPASAARLIEALFSGAGGDAMKRSWPVLALALHDDETALLNRARLHPQSIIARGVIDYLERQTNQSGTLSANGRAMLENLATGTPDADTARSLVWLVIALPATEVEWGFELLRTLPLACIVESGGADLLLDALHPIRAKDTFPPATLVRAVLAALVPLADFGRGHLAYELSQLQPHYPRECYEFFVARVRRAATLPPDVAYTPLPRELAQRFTMQGLESEADFEQICDELFAKALNETRHDHRSDWTALFQGIVIDHPKHWLKQLQAEIAQSGDQPTLIALTNLIRFSGSLIVFTQPDLARAFLAKAEDLAGVEARKEMERHLYGISGPLVRSYSNGSLKAASQHAEDPLMGPFYRWISTVERDDRERARQIASSSLAALDDA